MAGHDLIERYLARVGGALPHDAVDEIADGLTETYQRHIAAGRPADAAASTTIAEFGEPDAVVAAFIRQSPGRRTALALLASGPVVGACWGAVLVTGRAWTWPVPLAVRVTFGVVLAATIGTLLVAATGRRAYARTRAAGPAACALVVLDLTMLVAVSLAAPVHAWPLAAAVPASVVRLTVTLRALPRLLAR